MPDKKTPWWLWPNLLSLDAPIVAVAWLYMFARAWQVNYMGWESYLALGLAVWVVYVLDRLLDHRLRVPQDPLIGARHHFHNRFRVLLISGVVAAIGVIAWVVFKVLPSEIIIDYSNGQRKIFFDVLFSYAGIGVMLVLLFFSMVMASSDQAEVPYMRNLVAGLAFGYGTAIMAHVHLPTRGVGDLLPSLNGAGGSSVAWEVAAFCILCVLNITAIHLWEHSRHSDDPEVKAADEMVLTVLLTILAGFAMVFAYRDNPGLFKELPVGASEQRRPFFICILVSAALLQVLNRTRKRFSLDALRSLADMALVAPLPLYLIFEMA